MSANSHFLVLCHDTATGFARVGWAADYPPGRFIHLELVCESNNCNPVTPDSPLYSHYRQACEKARHLNLVALKEQTKASQAQGWLSVPLDLNAAVLPDSDDFGSYRSAAMQALRRLTGNCLSAWAVVVAEEKIIQLVRREPARQYGELEYQVWKHHSLTELAQYPGQILAGHLVIQESGLWFQPEKHP